METGFIDYEVSGAIGTITLNRPDAANAPALPLLDGLDEAWRTAAEDPDVRVLLRQPNGKRFSAGHDIRGVGDGAKAGASVPDTFPLQNIYEIESKRFLESSLRWR